MTPLCLIGKKSTFVPLSMYIRTPDRPFHFNFQIVSDLRSSLFPSSHLYSSSFSNFNLISKPNLKQSCVSTSRSSNSHSSAVTVRTVGIAREVYVVQISPRLHRDSQPCCSDLRLPEIKECSLIGSIVSGIEKLAGKAAKSSVKAAPKADEKVGAKRRRRGLNNNSGEAPRNTAEEHLWPKIFRSFCSRLVILRISRNESIIRPSISIRANIYFTISSGKRAERTASQEEGHKKKRAR